jgi:predicted PurR-regulated permease PerM
LSAQHDGMPPWMPRLLRWIVAIVVGLFIAYHLARALRGFLILVVISVFLAIALEPAVAYLSHRGWRRGLATGFIFLVVTVVASLFIALMVPLIVDQVSKLIRNLPGYANQASHFLSDLGLGISADRVEAAFADIDKTLQSYAGDLGGKLFGVGTTLLNTVFQGLTILLFTFYLTADAPRLRRTLLSVLPRERQVEVLRVIEIAIDKTGGYFYSRALLAGVAAFVTWVALRIIGVPYAVPLALWVGLLSQFVPVVGTYLGGILPILIGFLESVGQGIAVAVFIALYQQVENYIISPRITARTMSLHPAIAFGSAIVGATLMGAPGALMALPVAATIQAFVSTYLDRHELVDSALLSDVESARPRRSDEMGESTERSSTE